MADLRSTFEAQGAVFLTFPDQIVEKWKHIKAILFDWDGVFNNGTKTGGTGSPFSEPDSMGVNMLRYLFWKQNNTLPVTGIITGVNNETARYYAEREHFHVLHLNCKNKRSALEEVCNTYDITPDQVMYCFDDILDLPIATQAGLAMLIRRGGSPIFTDYVARHDIGDYVTGNPGGQNALREVAELMLALNGQFDEIVADRLAFEGPYREYLTARNQQQLRVHVFEV